MNLWRWGDEHAHKSVHSFTQTGSYTVTLATAVVTETDTLTRTSYITVSAGGCVSPTAGFSGSPLTGTAPLTVSFSDASSGTISGWWWSFGDGGSETNPSYSSIANLLGKVGTWLAAMGRTRTPSPTGAGARRGQATWALPVTKSLAVVFCEALIYLRRPAAPWSASAFR